MPGVHRCADVSNTLPVNAAWWRAPVPFWGAGVLRSAYAGGATISIAVDSL